MRRLGSHARVNPARAGQEIAGKTLELVGTENIDDVVVEFTMKVAKVDVTVTGTSAPDAPEPALLILFSDDPCCGITATCNMREQRPHAGAVWATRDQGLKRRG